MSNGIRVFAVIVAILLVATVAARIVQPTSVAAQGDPRAGRWMFYPDGGNGARSMLVDSATGNAWILGDIPATASAPAAPVFIFVPRLPIR